MENLASDNQTIITSDKILESNINYYRPKVFDIWCLGITIVIGGQYFGYNFGLLQDLDLLQLQHF